jgi:hypothetical protein
MTRRGKYTDRFEEVNYLFDDFVNAGAKIEWVSMSSGGVLFTFEQGRIKLSLFAPEEVTIETIRIFAKQLKSSQERLSKIISIPDPATIRHLQETRKVKT